MQEKVVLIDYEEKYADIGSKPCKCTNVIFVKEIR